MKALLQRVSSANVAVAGQTIGAIERGLLVLLAVVPEDSTQEVAWLADKILNLRLFPGPEAGQSGFDRSVVDIGGGMLVVSQFTMAGETRKGRRPSFSGAARPEVAEPLYDAFLSALTQRYQAPASGRFGADMQVSLVNDGPVTIWVETPA